MKAIFEKVRANEENSITAFCYQGPAFDAPFHFHPEYELTYIVASKGIRYVGNHISPFAEDDLVLIGSNVPHFWKNEKARGRHAQSLVVQWKEDVIHPLREFAGILALLKRAGRGIKFNAPFALTVKSKMEDLVNEKGLKRYLLLLDLLETLARQKKVTYLSTPDHTFTLSNDVHHRLKRVQEFVHDHYTRRITLAELAAQVHMTEQSFSRFFSKAMQKPFFSYLNEYRVQVAARILLESTTPVAQVGYETGFESLTFFYQQFKKYKHASPLQFRKMHNA
ncbi:helix-turn-helix domain-containing protein [Chryseolinea lacunae]|uniref:AraC family transcriptional regulator n=1 Tax=Chryseolinea lacunae TaxID=2801331 RepID=A0ABS1L3W0_9BACT|nr:AraC family transcriptional regulator [Chryseolinea lacunae]MBL0745627.1 AraC family transcriptional regulator [Chryseolinea lacunae]